MNKILLIIGIGILISLSFVIAGEITATSWEESEVQPISWHSANDIKVDVDGKYYSLQNWIKGDFTTEWRDISHKNWHNADDIKVNIGESDYSLQDAIDSELLKIPSSEPEPEPSPEPEPVPGATYQGGVENCKFRIGGRACDKTGDNEITYRIEGGIWGAYNYILLKCPDDCTAEGVEDSFVCDGEEKIFEQGENENEWKVKCKGALSKLGKAEVSCAC